MRRHLLLAASAVLGVVLAAVGGTYALFSASDTKSDTFTTGRLCISSERDMGDTVPGPMFYVFSKGVDELSGHEPPSGTYVDEDGLYPTGLWAPGDEYERNLSVYNGRDCLSVWIDSVQAAIQPGGYDPMVDKLKVKVYARQGGDDVWVTGEEPQPLSAFLNGPVSLRFPDGKRIPLPRGANMQMRFEVEFDKTADNSYQGKSLMVDFTVNAVQQKNNP